MNDPDKRKRRYLNKDEKRSLMSATIALFLRGYSRTSRRRGLDPNDREFDRDVQRQVRNMPAERFDLLIRTDED